jgi:hypothetical protein
MSVLVSNHNGTVGDTGSVSITIQPGTATCGPTPAPLVVKLAVP